jgi:hypothetical protein
VDDVELAKRVLSTIARAYRPLQANELQHALAVNPEDDDIDEKALMDVEIICSACAGLVTVEQESNSIRPVHYTAQEYFEAQRRQKSPKGHTELAETCLAYLLFNGWCESFSASRNESDGWERFSLLCYAIVYRGDHAREADTDELDNAILRYLSDDDRIRKTSNTFWRARSLWPDKVGSSGLFMTTAFGLTRIVKSGLKGQWHLKTNEYRRHMTALHCAAQFGRSETLSFLLTQGVDVNDRWAGVTALHLAARQGHEECLNILLEQGADVTLTSVQGLSALHVAALQGKAVEPFLNKGPMSNRFGIAFHVALTGDLAMATKLIWGQG